MYVCTYVFDMYISKKKNTNCFVLVSMNDLRKLKASVDNMSTEKMKAEKGDKNKKNKGKGKAKLRLDNSTVSFFFFYYTFYS